MALASFGTSPGLAWFRTLFIDPYIGSAASVYMVKEQGHSQTGFTEANVKWHFLAFFVSGLSRHLVVLDQHSYHPLQLVSSLGSFLT